VDGVALLSLANACDGSSQNFASLRRHRSATLLPWRSRYIWRYSGSRARRNIGGTTVFTIGAISYRLGREKRKADLGFSGNEARPVGLGDSRSCKLLWQAPPLCRTCDARDLFGPRPPICADSGRRRRICRRRAGRSLYRLFAAGLMIDWQAHRRRPMEEKP
jgi:hypothetical protein